MGMRMDRYELIERLGAGGMAEVWLAEQRGPSGFRRRCVVKRIHDHLADRGEFATRFEDEARLAALLNHPNIARVEDFGEVDGSLYMVLEYVDGWELGSLMRRGVACGRSMPPALALHIAAQIAKALGYAHALGQDGQPLSIVHRDVSPQNIMVERGTAVAKLVDFGIARAASNHHQTTTGVLKGKVAYFSPEQARNEDLDGRSDLFALGLVLQEMLTGQQVAAGGSVATILARVGRGDLPPLKALRPDLPAALWALMDRLLAPDREQRFASGQDVAAALRSVLPEFGGEPSPGSLDAWVAELPEPAAINDRVTSEVDSPLGLAPAAAGGATEPDHQQPSWRGTGAETQPFIEMSNDQATVIASPSERTEPDQRTVIVDSPLRAGPPEPATVVAKPPRGGRARRWGSVAALLLLAAGLWALRGLWLPAHRGSESPQPSAADVGVMTAPRGGEEPAAEAGPPPRDAAVPRRAAVKPIVVEHREATPAPAPAPAKPTLPPLTKRDLDAVTFAKMDGLLGCKKEQSGIELRFKIHPSGMVFGLRVLGANAAAEACLKRLVRRFKYPAHGGPTVEHSIKL